MAWWNHEYMSVPLQNDDVEEESSPLNHKRRRTHVNSIVGVLTILAISILINGAFVIVLVRKSFVLEKARTAHSYTGIEQTSVWKQHLWTTDYSSSNRSTSDVLWHGLRPAFGTVALDRAWAAEQRLPVSQSSPSDESKGLYIVDAYHQLHCLIMIRRALFEYADGQPQSYPLAHPTHCLDALRQAIMCRADDTPLYTLGDLTSGDGQWRQCRDWNALKQWAADRFIFGPHEPE